MRVAWSSVLEEDGGPSAMRCGMSRTSLWHAHSWAFNPSVSCGMMHGCSTRLALYLSYLAYILNSDSRLAAT